MKIPKIKCKQCLATLEINDPGCTRPDCLIRQASAHFKKDPVTGLYSPITMGKKRKNKLPPMPSMQILEQPRRKPREAEVIKDFKNNNYHIPNYQASRYNTGNGPWDDEFMC